MSLADLVPVVLASKMVREETKEPGMPASRRRWQLKNREHLRAYKREWDRKRKLARKK